MFSANGKGFGFRTRHLRCLPPSGTPCHFKKSTASGASKGRHEIARCVNPWKRSLSKEPCKGGTDSIRQHTKGDRRPMTVVNLQPGGQGENCAQVMSRLSPSVLTPSPYSLFFSSARSALFSDSASEEKTVSELCQAYGISRTTGHHWIKRYREVGSFAGLREKSRRRTRVQGAPQAGWNKGWCKSEWLMGGERASCSPCLRPKE